MPAAHTFTLHPAYLRHLVDYVRAQGLDGAELYGEDTLQRIARADLMSRHALPEWEEMVRTAQARTGDGAVMLKMAEHLKPWDIGAMGFITLASQNLRQAFDVLAHFYSLLNDAYTLHGSVVEGRGFEVRMVPAAGARSPLLEVYTLALISWQARWLSRRPDLVFDATFSFPAPVAHSERLSFQATFGGQLVFDSPASTIKGAADYAALPVCTTDGGVSDALRLQLEARMAQLHSGSHLLVHRIERILKPRLENGDVAIKDIAREAGLPVRTLQNQLKDSGLSYRVVLDRCRHAQALIFVLDQSNSLTQVAQMLGFATQSSFHHAFLRWTGMGPSDYRRSKGHLGGANPVTLQGKRMSQHG
jgi:AraC-like DNA-binding protein